MGEERRVVTGEMGWMSGRMKDEDGLFFYGGGRGG